MIFKSHKQKENHLRTKKQHLGGRKVQGTILESLHLSIMATSYHIHFTTYSNSKKNMT
jgi:hypothetical protein